MKEIETLKKIIEKIESSYKNLTRIDLIKLVQNEYNCDLLKRVFYRKYQQEKGNLANWEIYTKLNDLQSEF